MLTILDEGRLTVCQPLRVEPPVLMMRLVKLDGNWLEP
ncbi:hypothetical protein BGP_6471 [Beggiatoa sp. PS]|nr:hypothetical protein BGP_6471 [Beggiatoa sp. PS]